MSATSVSVVVPLGASAAAAAVAKYLETTGLTFEILTPPGDEYGIAVRRGVSEAKGTVIVIADAELPYPVSAIGDAVAMVESGATDVVFASTRTEPIAPAFTRSLLVPLLPDRTIHLAAFSSTAAKVLHAESRLPHRGCELEIAFLANKYGFRVEYLVVHPTSPLRVRSFGKVGGIASAIAIRWANRRNAYRAARRCPVCFSSEVWSCAQIPGNVVRACRRCKCRYLNQFTDGEGTPAHRVLRAHEPPTSPSYESHSPPARERTSLRRFHWLRNQLTLRARVLEVGVRDGSFGAIATEEFEYVGIDPASAAARHARARGLEVYCASLASFVNTGPAFDAITLFHVFENMADPHDTLGRIKDLLKPGGVLFLSTFDTEGLIYLFSEQKRMAQNFRTHLILYSRSALIELLEHSGFELIDIGPDFEYRDHKFLRHWISAHHPFLGPIARALLHVLPDPLILSTGSIRIVAKRRSGPPLNVRTIRSVEPTHAR
ncbi:MAG TPA: bifunctional glycosyltransferase/class I SAM-dependent methyltransferase [Thermoanaerobaculia bacterium]|jgi:SAM-dependent methyltransferase|nr:bifunctional glycosyltransferase/class I SAM-dependent methyltransferase [Thermoanaerobaculia bacterium]